MQWKQAAAVVVASAMQIGCANQGSPAGGADAGGGADAAASADAADPADAGSSHACAPVATAGHQIFDCPEGVRADVEVPAGCVAGGCGVVLDVHGYTMTADQLDQHTRMRTLATARGYVVVQPTAPGAIPSWGLGEHDDVVWDLLEGTIDALAIDRDRVHMTGFSQGGMMSWRQLCAHAGELASIAPVAGGGCFAGQEPAVQVPILYIHGHKDLIVSWTAVAVPQRDAVLAAWDFGEAEAIGGGDDYTATRWVTASGTPFEFWEHDYDTGNAITGGHCLPGPDDGGTYRCRDSEFDQAPVVLDFFDAHPRAAH
jgi:poly(3-hydroxybutyrate) depolymerase